MTCPIPITFTRQPPDCEGLWLVRVPPDPPRVAELKMGSAGLYDLKGAMRIVAFRGDCEWAGPLIVNENEAGEHQEGMD